MNRLPSIYDRVKSRNPSEESETRQRKRIDRHQKTQGDLHMRQTTDELNRYFAALRRHPLLSRDEEHALALAYRAGDRTAGQRLITGNLRLVVKLARQYGRLQPSLLDLIQEGNLGLSTALTKFDPDRGVRFASYAAWWIRAYILRHLVDSARLVRIGKTEAERKLFFKLRGEKARLEKLGFQPTSERVAEGLNLPLKVVREMDMRLGRPDLSLDAPLEDEEGGDGRSFVDLLADPEERADQILEEGEVRERAHADLAAFGRGLSGREQTIFYDRLLAEQPKTLEEVGRTYGISRERARQVEKELLDRLRHHLLREAVPANDSAVRLRTARAA
jgi:RNA polymerase sigma-32 factor